MKIWKISRILVSTKLAQSIHLPCTFRTCFALLK
nr:MAG TPA: hypothetical protein [Caudoviricetes sp.]